MPSRLTKALQNYSLQNFFGDLTAGVIVGIVALPLCIAFAIASGVPPEKGIFTGVIAGLAVAFFSGSRVQIAGPSGPFVVIAFGILNQFGPDEGLGALTIATLLAGLILIVMGKLGSGSLIKFIPYPVIAGFTAGVAVILVTTEVKDFFGLHLAHGGGSVVAQWITLSDSFGFINGYAAAIAAGTIALQIIVPKLFRRIPGSIVALVAATVIVQLLNWPVETIGSRFAIPTGIPLPKLPSLSWETARLMVEPSTAIAIMAAIEALLAAIVAEGMTGQAYQPNRVLYAQGIANIGSAIFGCLPATAAIARTATNVRNGARTPVAGIIHSLLLLLTLLILGRWVSLIPLACLAGILVFVAYNLLDWRSLKALMRNPKSDVAVLFATMAITIFIDLTTGIMIGMVIAATMFIKRMSSATHVAVVTREFTAERSPGEAESSPAELPPGVEVYEINGPFFFGAVYKLKETMSYLSRKPKVRIIRMSRVNVMDSTGLHALEEVYSLCRKQGAAFIISEIHAQPFTALMKSGLVEKFGEENIHAYFSDALARARTIIASAD